MKSKQLIFSCLIFMAFCSCEHSKTSYVDYFTEKYSNKELNLFYQACFNDTVKSPETLLRWNKDVVTDTIKGEADSSLIRLIDSVMSSYNRIGLPIKIKKNDSLQADISIKLMDDPRKADVPGLFVGQQRGDNYTSLYYYEKKEAIPFMPIIRIQMWIALKMLRMI